MESLMENTIEKCRICDISVTDGDFVSLFICYDSIIEKTYSGELFEELIQLPSTDKIEFPYICNGCDLQMKLFKRLKEKAWKRFPINVETDTNSTQEKVSDSRISCEEIKANGSAIILDTNNIICEVEEESQSSNNLDSYFENAFTKSPLNDPEEVVQSNDFFIVYNAKNMQNINIDDHTELENYKQLEENNIESQNVNQIIEFAESNEELNENLLEEVQIEIMNNEKESRIKSRDNIAGLTETECNDCGLSFPSTRALKAHRQEQHGRTHPCKICQKLFKTVENLEGHMRQHLGLPPYECELCTKTFNQKVHFQYHMKRHTNKRDFKCSLCGKSYFGKSDLTMHIKRTHEGEKNFVCSFKNCGKRFYFEQHLRYHSYVHSGRKSFECDVCQQKFVAPNALTMHKKTIHSTNARFSCLKCDKTFRRKHHLEGHALVHENANEKSDSCINSKSKRQTSILKGKPPIDGSDNANLRSDNITDFDKSTLHNINDELANNDDFLVDAFESCSENDNQNDSDNIKYC